MALILGIDPGSRLTGYGIINAVGSRLEYVTCGCIRLPDVEHPQRLKLIFERVLGSQTGSGARKCNCRVHAL
jgi:crossover junction endodeoxyribonuclease RuvC